MDYITYELLEMAGFIMSICAIVSSLVCFHVLFKHINNEQRKNKEKSDAEQSQVPKVS